MDKIEKCLKDTDTPINYAGHIIDFCVPLALIYGVNNILVRKFDSGQVFHDSISLLFPFYFCSKARHKFGQRTSGHGRIHMYPEIGSAITRAASTVWHFRRITLLLTRWSVSFRFQRLFLSRFRQFCPLIMTNSL